MHTLFASLYVSVTLDMIPIRWIADRIDGHDGSESLRRAIRFDDQFSGR